MIDLARTPLVRFAAHALECSKGESKGICILFLFVVLTLFGCDGGIEVTGKLEPAEAYENQDCELSFWGSGKRFWESEEKPYEYRTSKIEGQFKVFWTIGGPTKKHWLEIECPGYKVFRSEKFEAPTQNRKKDLGVVELKPKPSKSEAPKR